MLGAFRRNATARKNEVAGLAVASDERIEAYVLYANHPTDPGGATEILALRSLVDDDDGRLKQLLSRLRGQSSSTLLFPKVHRAEISEELPGTLGFRAGGGYRLYAARARSA